MNWILIKIFEYKIKRIEKYVNKSVDDAILRKAYMNMIKHYKGTIMFLAAQRGK